jgi:hypothetical protein
MWPSAAPLRAAGVVDPARDTSSVTAQGHGKGTRMRGGGFTAAARG